MKEFYNDFGFIIGFLILCLIIQMGLGDKTLWYFLLLTLTSMLVLNGDATVNLLKDRFTFKRG